VLLASFAIAQADTIHLRDGEKLIDFDKLNVALKELVETRDGCA